MDQKGIAPLIIVAIVVIAAVVVGVAVLVATRGEEGAPGGEGGGGGGDIGTATSLSFDVEVREPDGDVTYTGTFKGKNLGAANFKFRMEGTVAGVEFKVIADAGTEKAWAWNSATGWMDVSSYFQTYFDQYRAEFESYQEQLSGWTGGDYTYTDPTTGYSVAMSNIEVNPDLPDSLFQAPI